MDFYKLISLLSPSIFIFIGLIMKFSNNERQFGLFLKYKKYWFYFILVGMFSFLIELYKFLYLD